MLATWDCSIRSFHLGNGEVMYDVCQFAVNPSSSAKHLIFGCFDKRFRTAHRALEEKLDPDGEAELLLFPGGAGMFTDGDLRKPALRAARTAIKLHGVEELHLTVHWDCGHYGKSAVHQYSHDREWRFLCEELHKARGVVMDAIPELKRTHLYIITFDLIKALEPQPVLVGEEPQYDLYV